MKSVKWVLGAIRKASALNPLAGAGAGAGAGAATGAELLAGAGIRLDMEVIRLLLK